ncbi:DUF1707 SHOCT-like domain-containing protein [Embleya hyalina]|uniref:DUF1707 domain-containing protein n=1 Tax=Embleya hyalina TaxID=516124 RepID=A0A401YM49_9ACTN|nr:DUF1707 domain-containing protein [Embleya hyalina]GCD95693.1 hypothetical protein EHYA_03376 [Embleya hyalina]
MTHDIDVAVREDDRDAAANLLAEHYALGTLDKETLEARLSDVLAAATITQLSAATADLPALRQTPAPPSGTTRRRDERPGRSDSRRLARSPHRTPGRHRGGRAYALAALLVVVLCLVVDDPKARILVAILVATALTRKLHHRRHHHRRA